MTTADPTDALAAALDAAGQVLAAVRLEQETASTPCAEWTVRELAAHLIGGNLAAAAALRGEPPPEAGDPADLPDAYRDSAAALLAAFRAPGALERTVTIPAGTVPGAVALHLRTTEALVHGWDLARATGQAAAFPAEVAEQELVFTRRALAQMPPERRPFAPPQPVPDEAPAIDQLAACLGRAVTDGGEGRQPKGESQPSAER